MSLISPPHLKPGDHVAIVSTARKVEKAFIMSAIELLTSWGYKVQTGAHLFAGDNQYAGTDAERLSDLNKAIANKEIRAIFCARGGYGTARIVDGIDIETLENDPKWVIGYSDITALHGHLFSRAGLCSIHGTMPVNFDTNTPEAINTLKDLLEGRPVSYSGSHHPLNRSGRAEGLMVGGNLSVLYSILKSPSEPSLAGKILFIEDLDEYLYHVDRMMLNLRRSGLLADLAGLVVGGMTDMRDNATPFGKNAETIIAEHAEPYDFPICFGFPSGHIADNRAWIHGKKIRLVVNDNQPFSLNHF